MFCESCGMPMEKPGDFGGGRVGNRYCVHCTDGGGRLKSRAEVKEGMVSFIMGPVYEREFGRKVESREAAEKIAEDVMAEMPAWAEKEE